MCDFFPIPRHGSYEVKVSFELTRKMTKGMLNTTTPYRLDLAPPVLSIGMWMWELALKRESETICLRSGGRHSTEVAFTPNAQLTLVRFPVFPNKKIDVTGI